MKVLKSLVVFGCIALSGCVHTEKSDEGYVTAFQHKYTFGDCLEVAGRHHVIYAIRVTENGCVEYMTRCLEGGSEYGEIWAEDFLN